MIDLFKRPVSWYKSKVYFDNAPMCMANNDVEAIFWMRKQGYDVTKANVTEVVFGPHAVYG